MVQQKAYLEQVEALQNYIRDNHIPYVNNGMSLDGMDCQGLCEFLLLKSGVDKRECLYTGSNDMWRNALSWKGTPAECIAQFGAIPHGAWLFIHSHDGGEPDHYSDGEGNASHVGVYIGGKVAIHASASRGCVAESVFKGKAINGGWNMVGLCKHVDYALQSDNNIDINNSAPTIAVPTFAPLWEPNYSHLTWRLGDKGNGTKEVQTALQKAGYALSVDGSFGYSTEWAVKHFQTAHGLQADGIVGRDTWKILTHVING